MYGRFDLQAYYSGMRRCENFIPQTVGAISYRNGFKYAAKTAGNNPAFLWTFEYDDSLSFVLEFTDQKLRFYRNGGQIREDAQAITGITKANPAVVTYSGADNYSNGDSVYIDGVVGMPQVNGREFTVANVNAGANTFELSGINSTSYGTYSSGGTVAVITEVTTPYAEDDLFELKFAQNGLDLYIVHPTYAPRKLTLVTATSWTLSAHVPYAALGSTQDITAVTKANPAVVTYSGADNFTNGDVIFIKDVTGMTELNGNIYTVANVNTGANTFELSGVNSTSYTAYVSGGKIQRTQNAPFLSVGTYPGAVAFYEQRLVYGGSANSPKTLYFSQAADPNNFINGTSVSDGITYTVSGDGNSIKWLRGTSRFLAIGVFGDVLQATGGIDGVITPESISVRPSNSYGVANVNPIGRGTQVFYVQRNGLILRSFEYDFQADSYIPVDRNTISDHITKTGLKQIFFQEGRPNIVWAVRNDGVLVGMTIEDQESISGWHRHTTNGEFISCAATPRGTDYHQLWVCVKRGANYYMEYMTDDPVYPTREDYISDDENTDFSMFSNLMFEKQKEYVHMDSALTYDGSSYGIDAGATLTPAALTGSGITFTASASVFDSSMIGRELWRKSVTGLEKGRAEITGYTSSTVVTCTILEDFYSTDAIPAGEWFLTANELTGLDHLEGFDAAIVADGGQHTTKTVTDGAVSLDRQVSVAHVGLQYTGYAETTDIEAGGLNGPAQTKKKSISAVAVRFLNSLFSKYGASYYNLNEIPMRTAAMRMDRPPLLFTGDRKEIYANNVNDPVGGGWGREKRIIISQDLPFPCTVLLLIPYADVSN